MRYLYCLLLWPWLAQAGAVYELTVDIDPLQQQLQGTVKIQSDQPLALDTEGLNILTDTRSESGERQLTYRYSFNNPDDFAAAEHIVLHGLWYPRPTRLVTYRLSVTLPEGFVAVSEADEIQHQDRSFHFVFDHPLDTLTLIASNRYQVQTAQYRDIQLETYFLPGNAPLAADYLQRSQEYLALYEKLLSPYPFKRFAIVENPFPTGYAMPTYTLLGSRVIALPFILDTSLGHEILHQWFGNLVYIDFTHGNWAEGLTYYLAEHWYAEQRGEGAAFRKNILNDYAAYSGAMAVRDFRSRHNRAESAVGYGKVAMLFHALRQQVGDTQFFAALRRFIADNPFREASWHEIQRAFDAVSNKPLYGFFEHWLTRTDVPDIQLSKAGQLTMHQGQLTLSFSLQQSTPPYPLRLPLAVHTDSGVHTEWLDFTTSAEDFRLPLTEPPLRVMLDENVDLMRSLDNTESLPNLAKILGTTNVIGAVTEREKILYQPLLEALGIKQVVTREAVTFNQVRNNTLVIAGYDNYMVRMLFGPQAVPNHGVALQIRPNPYAPEQVIALLHAANSAEVQAASPKLSHYGKYATLAFDAGVAVEKNLPETAFGMEVLSEVPTQVIEPAKRTTIATLVPQLADKRVIFVGEHHPKFEHHLNQYLLIKQLHESGRKIAIGMEMFQQPYQQALDDYLAGKLDEAEFLQQTHYFDKWRYDYNLYKIILDYAKAQHIPVLALNIEGDINRKVGRGGLPALSEAEREHLPDQLDVSNSQYRRDLQSIYAMHPHGDGGGEFDYFLQGQAVWDESMAQTAAEYLTNHSDMSLVVLAGSGHVRYGYGIPQRLYRRTGLPYSVIVQDEELDAEIADYVLFSRPLAGTETPLMGVFLDNDDERLVVKQVSAGSVAEQAGLLAKDVVLSVDGKPVASLTELKVVLLYADLSKPVAVELVREGKSVHKSLDFTAKPVAAHH